VGFFQFIASAKIAGIDRGFDREILNSYFPAGALAGKGVNYIGLEGKPHLPQDYNEPIR
jgi:hypothetical protein